jgi:DNA-directed RNA polymerase subunit alpha
MSVEHLKSFGVQESILEDDKFFEVFSFKSLKLGMGTTIGNSLRRTLLANTYGYAIKSVEVSGNVHQFSSVAGVAEDVMKIIMNLRKVVFSGDVESSACSLTVSGPKIVTAIDISSPNLKVLNTDSHICSIEKGYELKLSFDVIRGYGTLKASTFQDELSVGVIPCDCFFSPVLKVNFEIVSSENGDYEDLNLSVLTNGSVTPKKALDSAIKLVFEQMGVSANLIEAAKETATEIKPQLNPHLFLQVDQISEMPQRATRCFKLLGIIHVGDLVQFTGERLMQEPQMGATSISAISEILSSMGLSLGMALENWPPKNLAEMAEEVKNKSLL